MKKLLLAVILCSCAVLANAQGRSVDLALDSIYAPDSLISNKSTAVHFSFRNLGTDTILPGDTLWYQMGLANNNFVLPSPTSFFTMVISHPYNPQDTIAVKFNINPFGFTGTSGPSNACVVGYIFNRTGTLGLTDSIKIETGTGTANNLDCRDIYVKASPGVSVEEIVGAGGVNVFPNPASSEVSVSYSLNNASEVSVKITDMTGKVVASQVNGQQSAGDHTMNFDISTFAPGMYITHIQIGTTVKTQKLIINR